MTYQKYFRSRKQDVTCCYFLQKQKKSAFGLSCQLHLLVGSLTYNLKHFEPTFDMIWIFLNNNIIDLFYTTSQGDMQG